jgi:hypothetical protein
MRKRPKWVPKSAEDWGVKYITARRKSGMELHERLWGCEWANQTVFTGMGVGQIIYYPKRRKIFPDKYCDCAYSCCHGLHYYHANNRDEFSGLIWENYLAVRCYVPKGEKWIEREGKRRASCLIVID